MGTGSYFDKALCESNSTLIGNMRMYLHGTRYDTIIGTGLSGTIFASRVAPGLSKKFAIVRKDKDGSHSGTKVEGHVGERWVFADDFVSTGATLKHVLKRMQEHHPKAEFAGVYQYEYDRFYTPQQAVEAWGPWVRSLAMGPPLGPLTRRQFDIKFPYSDQILIKPVDGWDDRVRALVPLPDRSQIALDTVDQNEVPGFWDCRNAMGIPGTDPRVADLVRIVMDYVAQGGNLRRLIGVRMDRFPKAAAVFAARMAKQEPYAA